MLVIIMPCASMMAICTVCSLTVSPLEQGVGQVSIEATALVGLTEKLEDTIDLARGPRVRSVQGPGPDWPFPAPMSRSEVSRSVLDLHPAGQPNHTSQPGPEPDDGLKQNVSTNSGRMPEQEKDEQRSWRRTTVVKHHDRINSEALIVCSLSSGVSTPAIHG